MSSLRRLRRASPAIATRKLRRASAADRSSLPQRGGLRSGSDSESAVASRPPTVPTDGRRPQEFRTRNDLIKSQRTCSIRNENAGKSTKSIDTRPLITVWLQVRVLPGPPAFAREASKAAAPKRLGEGGRAVRELRLGKP